MKHKNRWILRWLSALLVTVLVLALLAGCGGGQGSGLSLPPAGQESGSRTETAGSRTETVGSRLTGETAAEIPPAESQPTLTVREDGIYTSKDEVALYLHTYGKLPDNYITKKEAEKLGWKKKQEREGDLDAVAPGKSIGGSHFGNYEGQLPEKKGRKYFECDINYQGKSRGAERIIYSNDGLIFYTGDHYETFEQLYPGEEQ